MKVERLRHHPQQFSISFLLNNLRKFANGDRSSGVGLTSFASPAPVSILSTGTMIEDPRMNRVWMARVAAEIELARCTVEAFGPDTPVEVLGRKGPAPKLEPGGWIDFGNGLLCAFAARDRALLQRYVDFPSGKLPFLGSDSLGRYDEYHMQWGQILQCIADGREGQALGILQTAHRYTDPTLGELIAHPHRVEEADHAFHLIEAMLTGDQQGVTQGLYGVLKAHDAYWRWEARQDETDLLHPRGFFSLTATCLAAMAFDRGFQIEVESGYMPMDLVRGEDNGVDPLAPRT